MTGEAFLMSVSAFTFAQLCHLCLHLVSTPEESKWRAPQDMGIGQGGR